MSDMMQFIVHDKPVLRGESDYIARIALSPFGFEGQFEQIWLRRTTEGLATLCCIPFRAYGIALRDTVRISTDGSTVVEVVRHSGRRVLRALLAAELGSDQIRVSAREIQERTAGLGLLSEWSGDRHVAIDVPLDVDPASLLEYLEESEGAGRLHWEWSDAVPFAI